MRARKVIFIDPIALEMAWSRLISLLDEASNFMLRTSFSSIVREAKDFTIVLMDARGRVVAHPTAGCPPFNGTMPRTIRHLLDAFPLEQWHPGDFIVTNDPWMGTGHPTTSAPRARSFATARWSASPASSRIWPISVASCGRRRRARFSRKGCRFRG